MSAKLVAEYSVTDHLVVHSEGRISIWKQTADVRAARKWIVDVVKDDAVVQLPSRLHPNPRVAALMRV